MSWGRVGELSSADDDGLAWLRSIVTVGLSAVAGRLHEGGGMKLLLGGCLAARGLHTALVKVRDRIPTPRLV